MRRPLAAVAALAMIVAAVFLRDAIDERNEAAVTALRVVCTPELEGVCHQLDTEAGEKVAVRVEAPSATAAHLVSLADGADAGLDVWLAPGPWAAVVEARRQRAARAPMLHLPSAPAARSPLVLVAWRDRAEVLAPRCPESTVSWRCVGDAVAASGGWAAIGGNEAWGRVKVGFAPPEDDGSGLAALGDATRQFFGRSDLSAADLDDDAFGTWFSPLVRAAVRSSGTGTPVARMLAIGRSTLEVVGATEAELASVLASSPGRAAELTVVYAAPLATADVIAAVAATGRAQTRADALGTSGALRAALQAAGWRAAGAEGPPRGAPAAAPARPPSSNPLPPPGFLEALLGRWRTVAG